MDTQNYLEAGLFFFFNCIEDDGGWLQSSIGTYALAFSLSTYLFHLAESYKGSRRQFSESPSVQMFASTSVGAKKPDPKPKVEEGRATVGKHGQAHWEGSLPTPAKEEIKCLSISHVPSSRDSYDLYSAKICVEWTFQDSPFCARLSLLSPPSLSLSYTMSTHLIL